MFSINADRRGMLIILLSSVLLGIWAVENTIALRNFILVLNAFLSIIYLREWLIASDYSSIKTNFRGISFLCWLPGALILAMFIWVIAHYFLFSQFPQRQWDELTSTWLRAFMASIIGYGCALALHRTQSLAWLLWIGLLISFLMLIYQYIPKAIAAQSLSAIDWHGYYIYRAKFSGALAGVILFAYVLGFTLDFSWRLTANSGEKGNQRSLFQKIVLGLAIALGLLLPIYAFVFIFSTKNGVGVSTILLIFWFIVGGVYLLIHFFQNGCYKFFKSSPIRWVIGSLVILGILAWLGYQHFKNNPGWESLIEDIQIGAQVDKYQHWQNLSMYGYPVRSDGSSVANNTYERTALIVVGSRLIFENPIGNGIFRSLPMQMRQGGIEYDNHLYTHSAWIDLGLSFGLPGLLLLPIMLILCILACFKKYHGPYRATVASLAVSILVLYFVGEYAFQHGIEILLFISSLLAGLVLTNKQSNYSCLSK